ncbi:MAG: phosphotransferase [bacterium]|nr:phosphotransferase [bacterium]
MAHSSAQPIQAQLAKLGLSTEESPSLATERGKTYFSSVAHNEQGEAFFVKASLAQEPDVLRSLANEIYILKKITNLNNGGHVILPELIKGRVGKKFVWHVREYLEGHNFGDWKSGFSAPVLANLQFAKKLALGIYYLQVNLLGTADEKQLSMRKTEHILKDGKALAKKLAREAVITEKTSEAVAKKMESTGIQESPVFCHGSIEPKNILRQGKNVGLINWKNAVISNPAMDLASVWVYALREKKWQDEFINSYLELSSNQSIVEKYLDIEKIYRVLHTLNRFKEESRISSIQGEKKRFFALLIKTLQELV